MLSLGVGVGVGVVGVLSEFKAKSSTYQYQKIAIYNLNPLQHQGGGVFTHF